MSGVENYSCRHGGRRLRVRCPLLRCLVAAAWLAQPGTCSERPEGVWYRPKWQQAAGPARPKAAAWSPQDSPSESPSLPAHARAAAESRVIEPSGGVPSQEGQRVLEDDDKDEAIDSEAGETFTESEIGMAWMLLGSVPGLMALFYMVNWNDDDIRRYSWRIISSTVSIFVSVLLFQATEEFIMTYVPASSKITALLVNYGLFLGLFTGLQFCIAITSGANCEAEPVDLNQQVWCYADALSANYGQLVPKNLIMDRWGTKGVAVVEGLELFVQKRQMVLDRRQRFMKANATIFAHMTGFAAIGAGGHLMHLDIFAGTWQMAAVSLLINQVFLYLLFKGAKVVRKVVSGLDGTHDERDHMFDEEVHEAENDICSLSMSFLAVQVMRYLISGVLPDCDGHEHHEEEKTAFHIVALYLTGIAAALLAAWCLLLWDGSMVNKHPSLTRPVEMFQNQCSMAASWCVLFATNWLIASTGMMDFVGGLHTMAGLVLVSAALSLLSASTIRFLDIIEDHGKKAGGEADAHAAKVIQTSITSLGILVGFSWEHCFDGGVAAIASLTSSPHVTKLWLAIAVALGITPAWRLYILDKEMSYERNHQEEVNAATKDRYKKISELKSYSDLYGDRDPE